MRIHPGGFRLVLVGPKVSRLLPFLQARGFLAEAFQKGGEAQARLRSSPCHLLIVELELGDMLGVELGRAARQDRQAGAVILMDDPSKSGMIVSALSRGLETFVPIPPDESAFLERIELLLLAQWGIVVTQQQAQLLEELAAAKQAAADAADELTRARADTDEQVAEARKLGDDRVARLETQFRDVKKQLDDARRGTDDAIREATAAVEAELAEERRKVEQLRRETAVLRDQLTSMHLVTGAKSGVSDEGGALPLVDPGDTDFGDDEAPTAQFELPPRPAPVPVLHGSAAANGLSTTPTAPAALRPRPGAAPGTPAGRAPMPAAAVVTEPVVRSAPAGRAPARAGEATAVRTATGGAKKTSGATSGNVAGDTAGPADDLFEPHTEKGAHAALRHGGPTLREHTGSVPRVEHPAASIFEPPSFVIETSDNADATRPVVLVPVSLLNEFAEATIVRDGFTPPPAATPPAPADATSPRGAVVGDIQARLGIDRKTTTQRPPRPVAPPTRPAGAAVDRTGDVPSFANEEEVLFVEDD